MLGMFFGTQYTMLSAAVSYVYHSTCYCCVSKALPLQGVSKNDPTCFCQNFVKSPLNLIIFSIQIAKMIEICRVHSLSTTHNLC